jgi:hypothetical protein
MAPETPRRQKRIRRKVRLVKKAFKKWLTPLGLRWWRVTFVWSDKTPREKGQPIAGKTFADWRYHEATVYIYQPHLLYLTDEEVEPFVLHELVHILVNEMRRCRMHHEERVVSDLTRAFRWTWQRVGTKE